MNAYIFNINKLSLRVSHIPEGFSFMNSIFVIYLI